MATRRETRCNSCRQFLTDGRGACPDCATPPASHQQPYCLHGYPGTSAHARGCQPRTETAVNHVWPRTVKACWHALPHSCLRPAWAHPPALPMPYCDPCRGAWTDGCGACPAYATPPASHLQPYCLFGYPGTRQSPRFALRNGRHVRGHGLGTASAPLRTRCTGTV